MKSRSNLKKVTRAVRGKRGTVRRSYWVRSRTISEPKGSFAAMNHPGPNAGSTHSLFALLVGKNRQIYGHALPSTADEPTISYGYTHHRNFAEGITKTTSDILKGTQHQRRSQAAFDVLSGSAYDVATGGTGGDRGRRWEAAFGARYGRSNIERK